MKTIRKTVGNCWSRCGGIIKTFSAHFRKEKNMTTNEILELVRAGYTKAEIEAMNGTAEQKQEQEQKAPEQKAPEQKQEQEQKAPEQPTDNNYEELTDLVKNLTETVKAMQADNARKASGEQPPKATAENAIKSFFGDIPKN